MNCTYTYSWIFIDVYLHLYLNICTGSIFLSVCINKFQDVKEKNRDPYTKNIQQLYRIDAPLKIRKDLKSEKITTGICLYIYIYVYANEWMYV